MKEIIQELIVSGVLLRGIEMMEAVLVPGIPVIVSSIFAYRVMRTSHSREDLRAAIESRRLVVLEVVDLLDAVDIEFSKAKVELLSYPQVDEFVLLQDESVAKILEALSGAFNKGNSAFARLHILQLENCVDHCRNVCDAILRAREPLLELAPGCGSVQSVFDTEIAIINKYKSAILDEVTIDIGRLLAPPSQTLPRQS